MVVWLKIQINAASCLAFWSKVALFSQPSQDPELHLLGGGLFEDSSIFGIASLRKKTNTHGRQQAMLSEYT